MYRNATHKHSRALSLLCSPQLPYTSPITYNIPHKVIIPSFYIHASICRRDGAAAVGATGKSGTKMKVDAKSFHRRRSTTVVDGFSATAMRLQFVSVASRPLQRPRSGTMWSRVSPTSWSVIITSSSAAAERPREPLSQLKSCQLLHNGTKKSHLTRRIALSCGIKISPVGSLD